MMAHPTASSTSARRKRFRMGALAVAALCVQATGVSAQAAPLVTDQLQRNWTAGLDRVTAPAPQQLQAPVESLVTGGVIGGAAGWIIGALAIGAPLAHAMTATDDGLSTPGIIIGFEIGQAVGIASGVHLANARRGDFGKSLLLSAAAGALGTALLWTDDFDEVFETRRSQVILIAVPLVQLVASIHHARAEANGGLPE